MAAKELSEKGYHVISLIGGIQSYTGRNLESYNSALTAEPKAY